MDKFKFGPLIRDTLIAILLAAVCWLSNNLISLNAYKIETAGQLNTLKVQHDLEQGNTQEKILGLEKRYDELSTDINKKLDRLGDKVDRVLERMNKT